MNETLKTIRSLRTIHGNFSDREVSDGDLQTILSACVRAANASGAQSYSVIVLDDREVMKKLGYAGSRALVFCVDLCRRFDMAGHLNIEIFSQNIISLITSSTDTILAAQTAAIAAKSLGIDSMFTNCIHRAGLHDVYQLLNLPRQKCFPLIELILGYPDKEPAFQKGRLDGTGIIHYGTYKRLSGDEMDSLVELYDDKRKHLGMIENWEEEGFVHYLDYYYTAWNHNITEAKILEFYDVLTKAGFLDPDMVKGG